jgi:AcrR family transcriptional regulator
MAATTEGLRERKKRQTREAIARAAMDLFVAHGYDEVTVADVARAADVSEKTVFNHFPTKEDLVLHGGQERRAALIEAIRTRPPGASLVEPFRDATMAFVDTVESGEVEGIVAVPRLVAQSRSLRDRLFIGWEEEAATLSPLIAEEAGAAEGDLVPAVVARTLAWTHRLVFRAAFSRLLAGEDHREVAADLREQARRAYDQLEVGLAGYGVRSSASSSASMSGGLSTTSP